MPCSKPSSAIFFGSFNMDLFAQRSSLCQPSAVPLTLRSKPRKRNRRASGQGRGRPPGQPRDRRRPTLFSILGCWFSTSYRPALLRPPIFTSGLSSASAVSAIPWALASSGINPKTRIAVTRAYRSVRRCKRPPRSLPCLCFPTLTSFGRRLSIAARTRLPAVVSVAAVIRSCLGDSPVPISFERAGVSDLLVVPGPAHSSAAATPELWTAAAQTASSMRAATKAEHPGMVGGTHLCTIDSPVCGVKMLVHAFWSSFFGWFYKRRMSREAAFPHPQLGDNCLTPGPVRRRRRRRRRRNRRCPGRRGIA